MSQCSILCEDLNIFERIYPCCECETTPQNDRACDNCVLKLVNQAQAEDSMRPQCPFCSNVYESQRLKVSKYQIEQFLQKHLNKWNNMQEKDGNETCNDEFLLSISQELNEYKIDSNNLDSIVHKVYNKRKDQLALILYKVESYEKELKSLENVVNNENLDDIPMMRMSQSRTSEADFRIGTTVRMSHYFGLPNAPRSMSVPNSDEIRGTNNSSIHKNNNSYTHSDGSDGSDNSEDDNDDSDSDSNGFSQFEQPWRSKTLRSGTDVSEQYKYGMETTTTTTTNPINNNQSSSDEYSDSDSKNDDNNNNNSNGNHSNSKNNNNDIIIKDKNSNFLYENDDISDNNSINSDSLHVSKLTITASSAGSNEIEKDNHLSNNIVINYVHSKTQPPSPKNLSNSKKSSKHKHKNKHRYKNKHDSSNNNNNNNNKNNNNSNGISGVSPIVLKSRNFHQNDGSSTMIKHKPHTKTRYNRLTALNEMQRTNSLDETGSKKTSNNNNNEDNSKRNSIKNSNKNDTNNNNNNNNNNNYSNNYSNFENDFNKEESNIDKDKNNCRNSKTFRHVSRYHAKYDPRINPNAQIDEHLHRKILGASSKGLPPGVPKLPSIISEGSSFSDSEVFSLEDAPSRRRSLIQQPSTPTGMYSNHAHWQQHWPQAMRRSLPNSDSNRNLNNINGNNNNNSNGDIDSKYDIQKSHTVHTKPSKPSKTNNNNTNDDISSKNGKKQHKRAFLLKSKNEDKTKSQKKKQKHTKFQRFKRKKSKSKQKSKSKSKSKSKAKSKSQQSTNIEIKRMATKEENNKNNNNNNNNNKSNNKIVSFYSSNRKEKWKKNGDKCENDKSIDGLNMKEQANQASESVEDSTFTVSMTSRNDSEMLKIDNLPYLDTLFSGQSLSGTTNVKKIESGQNRKEQSGRVPSPLSGESGNDTIDNNDGNNDGNNDDNNDGMPKESTKLESKVPSFSTSTMNEHNKTRSDIKNFQYRKTVDNNNIAKLEIIDSSNNNNNDNKNKNKNKNKNNQCFENDSENENDNKNNEQNEKDNPGNGPKLNIYDSQSLSQISQSATEAENDRENGNEDNVNINLPNINGNDSGENALSGSSRYNTQDTMDGNEDGNEDENENESENENKANSNNDDSKPHTFRILSNSTHSAHSAVTSINSLSHDEHNIIVVNGNERSTMCCVVL